MRSEPGYLGEERTASTKILTWDEPGVFKEATNCVWLAQREEAGPSQAEAGIV